MCVHACAWVRVPVCLSEGEREILPDVISETVNTSNLHYEYALELDIFMMKCTLLLSVASILEHKFVIFR